MILSLALAACATGPELTTAQRYQRMQWAQTGAEQAEAECHAEIQRNPLLGMPTCMRAKGWQER